MRKIMVAVAPVSHDVKGSKLDPIEIAEEVIACAEAGASMVHLHVRDENGNQSYDLTHFTKTLDVIRSRSDIVIQGSTGGVCDLSLEDRCVSVREPRVQTASLNMGSTNADDGLYTNTLPDIRFWAKECEKYGVLPEFEVFDTGMVNNVKLLAKEGYFKHHPHSFNIALGFVGCTPAEPEYLLAIQRCLPAGAHWGICVHHMKNMQMHALALGLGADFIRVGYEDGTTIYNEGFVSNVDQVKAAVELVRLCGLELATPADVRATLNITRT